MSKKMSNKKQPDSKDQPKSKSQPKTIVTIKINPSKVNDKTEELKLDIDDSLKLLNSTDDVQQNLRVLDSIIQHINSATGFSTLPDILKVLAGKYEEFKKLYEIKQDEQVKKNIADILSFICTSHPKDSQGEVLKYYLLGNKNLVTKWGICYVRDLTKDIVDIWKQRQSELERDRQFKQTLLMLIQECALYQMKQNSEIEACDLLLETEQMNMLEEMIKSWDACEKICHYITTCSSYLPEPEDENVIYAALSLNLKNKRYVQAFFAALQLHSLKIIERIYHLCSDLLVRKQMLLIMARHNMSFEDKSPFDTDLVDVLSNSQMNRFFIMVARHLDVMTPKTPNDIINKDYKFRQKRKRLTYFNAQSSILGSTFMNCFVNAAFSVDKLLLTDKGLNWISRHVEKNRISAAASIGVICLWDMDGGLNKIDNYLYAKDDHILAGALMAFGLVNCTIKSEYEPAFLLLKDYLNSKSRPIQIGSLIGLSMAYLGTNHNDVLQCILDRVKEVTTSESEESKNFPLDISAMACGLIGHSFGDMSTIQSLLEIVAKEKDKEKLKLSNSTIRNTINAIGLLSFGRKKDRQEILKILEQTELPPNLKKYASIWIDICTYAGTSNILKVQELMRNCTPIIMKDEPKKDAAKEKEKDKDKEKEKAELAKTQPNPKPPENADDTITDEEYIQMISIVGIGLISMTDNINCEMVFRTFADFLKLANNNLKSVIVLSIALTHLSDPKMNVIEFLVKYGHSLNENVAMNSILALGMVCAGTNHTRVAKMLVDLSDFYRVKTNCLFAVKVAQGLLHLGKGLLTLSPHMEYGILRHSSVCSVLALILNAFQPKDLLEQSYFLFYLTGSIMPKMFVTLDGQLEPISVPIRVGQAVDIIGQAGNPRSISGFQTFNTPVLLNRNEKAELATEEYDALSSQLEGLILIRKKGPIELLKLKN